MEHTTPPPPGKIGFTFTKTDNSKRRKIQTTETETKSSDDEADFVVAIQDGNIERYTTTDNSETNHSASGKTKNKEPLIIPMPENRARFVEKKYLDLIKKKKENGSPANREEKQEGIVQTESTHPKEQQEEKSLDEEAMEELVKEATAEQELVEVDEDVELPLLLKYRNTNLDSISDEQQRFLADVESRPEEASLEQYMKVPVSKFGIAALRGMGWSPGTPIGLTNPQVVQPIEFVQPAGYRTGLGATPKQEPKKQKKYIKPGESRDDEEMVLPPGPDGVTRHVKTIDEKLVKKSKLGIQEGSLVGIIAGKHDGLYARVLKLTPGVDEAVVSLEASSEVVTLRKSDLTLIDEKKLGAIDPSLIFEQKANSKSNDSKRDKDTKVKYSKDSDKRDSTKDRPTPKEKESEKDKKQQRIPEKGWLFPNIIVLVVSKSFSGGKYYLKKGKVFDVLGGTQCTLQLVDSGKLIEGKPFDVLALNQAVKQRMLETVVPKVGERVMVVEGERAGQLAKIMEKGKEEALVQMFNDFSVVKYHFDSICQYVDDQ